MSPKYIEVIDSTLQKYITKFGKDTNELKIFNLGVLAKAIDTYKTNLVNSKNTKNLHLKLAILNLLKFDTLKEIYLFNEAIASVNDIIKLKYSCDNNETFTIEIDKDDLTLNDNKTKMLYNLTRVVSADGEKFENETNMVWLKANSGAIFERNGTEFYTNCKLQ
ncbi:MAG: MliC family protein [Candidatus Peribacteria bacterium]|nr:MliC family protein [Candidatus Peribacteria bacterium]